MSVAQKNTRLVQKSIIEHLKAALVAAGWTTAASWVIPGFIPVDFSDPPVVGVPIPERRSHSFELGNSNRQGTYFVDIEVKAKSNTQLTDLMESIGTNLDNIAIINFNTAEPEDVGYDAAAQTVARSHLGENVSTRVMDEQDHTGRVSFRLRESKPF